jgi:Type IV secretion-system coupling protein DNA-binding domain
MRRELTWFGLRFPRDLTEEAVLAVLSALSGVSAHTRLVFDLSAGEQGIEHRLAISSNVADIAASNLRAAIPSLRLNEVQAPNLPFSRRLIWQVAPRTSPLRIDTLAASTASLLAGLFPLGEQETIRLLWHVRPSMRPALVMPPELARDGYLHAMRAKLAGAGLSAYGELRVQAEGERTAHLLHRVTSVLRSLSTPYGRLLHDPYWYGQLLRLFGLRGRYLSATELAAVIGWPIGSPDLPGLELGAAKRLVPSAELAETGRVLGLSDFAGLQRPVALTPSASTRGLYVLGPTGTGKTSLLTNLIRDDLWAGRGLAVVETNGDLIQDLLDLIPPERIKDVVLLDPLDAKSAIGFNPFAGVADASLVADQIGELFERLWHDFWGPRTGQLAHMALLTLARRSGSTLIDLPRLFLDPTFRRSALAGLDDPLGLEIDWRWYEHLPTREQATVIAPLLNKVRAFTARPSIRAIVGQATPVISMQRLMHEAKVLLVYLPKGLIGAETAQLLGCLVLTSLWQAATERARLPIHERTPFGLYVDEVQDFAAAPIPWDEMFAQGRKYGLALSVAHQNLAQLPKELREVVLANARSKAVFALSAADARSLEPLFAPSLTTSDLQALDAYSIAATVALDDGSVARPVTLRTPEPTPPLGSRDAVRASSRAVYARPRAEVEAELRSHASPRPPAAPVGRKKRSAR